MCPVRNHSLWEDPVTLDISIATWCTAVQPEWQVYIAILWFSYSCAMLMSNVCVLFATTHCGRTQLHWTSAWLHDVLPSSLSDKCILPFYDFHIHVPCWCLMYESCSQPLIVGGPSYTGHQHGYMMYCRPAWVTSVYCYSMIFIFMCHVDV